MYSISFSQHHFTSVVSEVRQFIDNTNSVLSRQEESLLSIKEHLEQSTIAFNNNSHVLEHLSTALDSNFSDFARKKDKGKGRADGSD